MSFSKITTYQEFEGAADRGSFIRDAIAEHRASEGYRTARDADEYDHQRNPTIRRYVRTIMGMSGRRVEDPTASNNRIASNLFHRLNTQRNMYSLGNGISFAGGGEPLGPRIGRDLQEAGYWALIHGVSFCFWNVDRVHVFPLTQFVPFWDEETGALRAGVRFWRLDEDSPMTCVLYEEDGYTRYRERVAGGGLVEVRPKRAYKLLTRKAPADRVEAVVGEENYGSLPIVPLWGSKLHQSTLVGMREAIDSYDLIRSGFANDLTDVAEIYWIVENAGGMTDSDLARLRDRAKLTHIVSVPNADDGVAVRPYVQEIPYEARKAYLDMIRAGIYEDFGALDVHTVAAGATNDHIDAAYQPMDEEASDFEMQVKDCVLQLLALVGRDDSPVFKRQRISNQREQVEVVSMEAQWLDEETILSKLPNVSPEEVADIMRRRDAEDMSRMPTAPVPPAGEGDGE